MGKYVYFFGNGKAEGRADMTGLLGGKGANLAEMCLIDLPVPAGFTITTEVCTYYYDHGKSYPKELKAEVEAALKKTEEVMGAKFGDPKKPLLVSCRSGARVSMPGMMDTVHNIGLNESTLKGLVDATGNERFAWDRYRRFVQMYGDVVLDLKPQGKEEIDPFETIIDDVKHERGVKEDTELTVKDLQELVKRFKKAVKEKKGKDFPDDPMEQMWGAVASVFDSWNSDRAIDYRRQNGYPHDWGTAVNICSMVFGNMGDDSGTGVAFTRDPASGENVFYGEYLINAQGEDVVAGIRTPKKIAELKEDMPSVYAQLDDVRKALEKHYRDVQDIEFTIQKGKVWVLQTRKGKLTGFAAVRFAVDMVDERLLTETEAVFKVEPTDLLRVVAPRLLPPPFTYPLARGIPGWSGAVTGVVAFSASSADELRRKGLNVILAVRELGPSDLLPAQSVDGVLTAFGGISSHGALYCRQHRIPGVIGTGCEFTPSGALGNGKMLFQEGDLLSIDGTNGEVYHGAIPHIALGLGAEVVKRFTRLIDGVSSDMTPEGRIGTFWLMRDLLAGFPDYSGDLPRSPWAAQTQAWPVAAEQVHYHSFCQPTQAALLAVRDSMDWDCDEDTRRCVWGALFTLTRYLQHQVGIGNHFQVLRPLADPSLSMIEFRTRSGSRSETATRGQLVGIEFFGINRWVKNWLPWGAVRFWIAVELSDGTCPPWRLDRTNPGGESLMRGCTAIAGFSCELDGSRMGPCEFRKWYGKLRDQDQRWDWYGQWGTSWREVHDALTAIDAGEKVQPEVLAACQSIGLVDQSGRILFPGRQVIRTQTARQRKEWDEREDDS